MRIQWEHGRKGEREIMRKIVAVVGEAEKKRTSPKIEGGV